ncbi:MAG TPA: SpoIIE family protein phosphatase [Terracidiphilus sp.]|nr:SpoIIE family protein phosphatase [Terracidiphilus sp.]
MPVDGPWQFHTGDNPAWAAPAFDDSAWEPIATGATWDEQGHYDYTGFAWYRRHIELPPGISDLNLALYLTNVDSAAEVYWNGKLVGGVGRVPPHPVWYVFADTPSTVVPLGPARSGVLAIRVWKAPRVYYSFPLEGGLQVTPRIGSVEAIENYAAAQRLAWLQSTAITRTLNVLFTIAGLLALLMWLRERRQTILLWLSICMFYPTAFYLIAEDPGVTPFRWSYGMIGAVIVLNNFALWSLLVEFFGFDKRGRLARWSRVLALIGAVLSLVDAVFQLFDWTQSLAHVFLIADISSTLPEVFIEFWTVVLLIAGFRRRLDAAHWFLAITGMCTSLLQAIEDNFGLGTRWTHWHIADLIATPIVTVAGNRLDAQTIAHGLFLVAVLYVAWRYAARQRIQQSNFEQEYRSAQELQQVLIPAALPELPGYRITSAYRPAQEVGGDFFQVIPLGNGGALVVVGDVSGKGLHAAMAVALIVGAIHSTLETTTDPAALLAALNRRLHGRLRGGFATCLVLRLAPSGQCIAASAGHLPPYRNGDEVLLPPALPLGLMPEAEYETFPIALAPNDRLTLYTDGLLEARNAAGDLYGFARIGDLLTTRPDAPAIAEAAVHFGQEDDITVLTLEMPA